MSLISQAQEYRATLALLLVGTIGFLVGRLTTSDIPDPKPTSSPSSEPKEPISIEHVPIKENEKAKKPVPTTTDSDWEEEDQGELADFSGIHEECKLVLVVRTDLGMTKGKIAAQASHATLACYKALLKTEAAAPGSRRNGKRTLLHRWESTGQAKIAVQVKSEDELMLLQAQAMSLGLCARIIHDAGRTQIAANSATVLGIGPAPKSVVDQVTKHLKLL
ncbi:hypothetical protein FKW77_001240 [Venturia effusa]|uniref:peptidyl-tRNA hydrolase n=1 Tax=Venturia effusa TaxID=50376 RepID=A0A517LD59_9PEZI|nr:hypothetical protein FKW77_001240 [Venturia effusa]